MKCVTLLLAIPLVLAGCTVRRFGPELTHLPPGTSYAEAVRIMGNPSALRDVAQGGTEGVWIGTATEGGSFKISYTGVTLLQLGRTETAVAGRRLRFDRDGLLVRSETIGPGDPVWRVIPFGR